MYVVLAGGVGGARFLRGLTALVPPDEVTAIVNVGDDLWIHGLRVCPDIDSITYWLGGVIHPGQQWGRADESHTVASELARFGHEGWFTLGDRDLATHLHRTARLREGRLLSEVTDEIRRAFGVAVRLLPASDDPVETRIHTKDGRDLHFQEYWVRERAVPHVRAIEFRGADAAQPAHGVIEALLGAEVVLIAPSNPIASIDPILAVPGMRETLEQVAAPIIGVSPIIAGKVVRGMADKLLAAVGADPSAAGVAAHYGDLLDGWIVDDLDADAVEIVRSKGVRCVATCTMMDDPRIASELAQTCVDLARAVRR